MKTVVHIRIDKIIIPDFVEREPNKVQDDLLRKSIETGGIQQPLALVADGGEYLLAKGSRRIREARHLGITTVPAVVEKPPRGVGAEDHARRLRFILDQHRQDLVPSQKCELVETLKAQFGMNNKQVAAYLGIVPDSVTNYLAVRNYIPPVVAALDAGILTGNRARVLDGMSPEGQQAVWKRHAVDLRDVSPKVMYRRIREEYSPQTRPSFYRDAQMHVARLNRQQAKRRTVKRPLLDRDDKRRLSDSLELREIELRNGNDELAQLKREIQAAIVPVAAILRNAEVRDALPSDMREELERFAEVYV